MLMMGCTYRGKPRKRIKAVKTVLYMAESKKEIWTGEWQKGPLKRETKKLLYSGRYRIST